MSDLFALVLGVIILVVWVCALVYADSLRRVYSLGYSDYIARKNRCVDYKGLAYLAYRRGRRQSAFNRNAKLKSRLVVHRLTI